MTETRPETSEDDVAVVDQAQPEAVIERRRAMRSKMRVTMRSGALMTPGYLFMNALAAVIASYGLLANSPAVVIGAMIVAVLLGPIMGVALALSDGDWHLLRRAGVALLAGGLIVFGIGALIGWLHAESPITAEITSRTAPNLFDLAIALAGGAAGAYATVSTRMAAGFVGVAIATALVPPLTASAILTTRGEWDAAGGAFLLAVTNIIAIQFAAAIVLWVNGFARDDEGGHVGLWDFIRRHAIGLIVLLGLGGVLAANLNTSVSRQFYENGVRATLSEEMAKMEGNQLTALEFLPDGPRLIVRAEVSGPREPTFDEVRHFASLIPPRRDGQPVDLRVRYVQTRIITPEGYSPRVIDRPLDGPPVPNP